MEEIINSLLEKNMEERSDYAKKYEELLAKMESNVEPVPKVLKDTEEESKVKNKGHSNWNRVEKNKPYYIFNDAQMEDIIEKNPQAKEELCQISGFGNVKVEKYGRR